jgi:hypothetical protein
MGITVSWLNEEKTRFSVDFSGNWTWDELYPVLDDIYDMLESIPHKADAIFDFTHSTGLPTKGALLHLKNSNRRVHPNQARVLLVGLSAFASQLIKLFNSVYGAFARQEGLKTFATREEALAYLNTAEEPKVLS